jgi:hypothetical protein
MFNELNEKQEQLMALLAKRFLPKKDGKNAVAFVYYSGIAAFTCSITIDLVSKGIFLSAVLATPMPEAYQMTALEWCNAINDKSLAGHFSIDPETGYVKWSYGIYFWKMELTERIMRTLLESSILNIDYYSHSLLYIFNGSAEHDYEGALALIGEDPGISISKNCLYTYEKHPSIEKH